MTAPIEPLTLSTSSVSGQSSGFTPSESILGSTLPRLWTRPLVTGPPGGCPCGCALTSETSYGFDVIVFAREVLGEPLDAWQELLVIHGGELLPDGRPRFRRLLVLVARQQGKTHAIKVLALFWMFVERWPMVYGTSSALEYAKEAFLKAVKTAEGIEALSCHLGKDYLLKGNNDTHFKTTFGSKYKIGAATRRAARSLAVDRAMADEVREQKDWDAYAATYNAMNARPYAQYWGISNEGDDTAAVLHSLRESALKFIDTGVGDPRLGLLEWSAPEGCDIEDPAAWAAAMPNLGRRTDVDSIAGAAATAKQAGGREEAMFRIEVLCQRVKIMNSAIDAGAWSRSKGDGTLALARGRLAALLDVSPDGLHATLVVAGAVRPGVCRVVVSREWDGPGCTRKVRAQLPGLLAELGPRVFGWFPTGPAAALAADLRVRSTTWPPRGVKVEEIKSELAAVCMGFAEQVLADAIEHANDPLLTAHATGAEKLWSGSTWVFSRKGGHCDALYAAAGATHLARMLPPARSARVPKRSATPPR